MRPVSRNKSPFLPVGESGRPGHRQGQGGQAVVLVVGVLAGFLIFFFVLIDFAYMYYVRGQLQNAADAAAPAGGDANRGGKKPPPLRPAGGGAGLPPCRNSAAGGKVFLVASESDCDSPP